jgi:hypothetical protein
MSTAGRSDGITAPADGEHGGVEVAVQRGGDDQPSRGPDCSPSRGRSNSSASRPEGERRF